LKKRRKSKKRTGGLSLENCRFNYNLAKNTGFDKNLYTKTFLECENRKIDRDIVKLKKIDEEINGYNIEIKKCTNEYFLGKDSPDDRAIITIEQKKKELEDCLIIPVNDHNYALYRYNKLADKINEKVDYIDKNSELIEKDIGNTCSDKENCVTLKNILNEIKGNRKDRKILKTDYKYLDKIILF